MPKAPINQRTLMFTRLRGDKTIRLIDWNVVDTELGPMIEPRHMSVDGGSIPQRDITDGTYTSIVEYDEDGMVNQYSHNGLQLPADYNT